MTKKKVNKRFFWYRYVMHRDKQNVVKKMLINEVERERVRPNKDGYIVNLSFVHRNRVKREYILCHIYNVQRII